MARTGFSASLLVMAVRLDVSIFQSRRPPEMQEDSSGEKQENNSGWQSDAKAPRRALSLLDRVLRRNGGRGINSEGKRTRDFERLNRAELIRGGGRGQFFDVAK